MAEKCPRVVEEEQPGTGHEGRLEQTSRALLSAAPGSVLWLWPRVVVLPHL